jgi:tetratricopeptide (TPR) repeat protein
MKLRLAALLIAMAATTGETPARAANPALEEAKTLTSQATIEYDVGHFDQALELYTKAYERYPKPALLFDIGQCHRQLGHYERALFFFHGYLRGQPDAPNRSLVEKFIDDAQQKLDAQRAAESATPAAAPAPDSSSSAGALTPAPISGAPGAPDAAPASDRGSPALFITGLATAGVGVVLLGSGVYAGVHSQSLANQVSQVSSQHGTWTSQDQSNYDSGKSSATVANVLYVTGGVALAAGAILAWLGWPKGQAPVTGVVLPSPGGASAALVARF